MNLGPMSLKQNAIKNAIFIIFNLGFLGGFFKYGVFSFSLDKWDVCSMIKS